MGSYVRTRRVITIPTPPFPVQIALALALGLALFLFSLLAVVFSYNLSYQDAVFPGVRVGGVELGGMSLEQSQIALAQQLSYPEQGRIIFKDNEQLWTVRPAELGLYLDAQTSALAAFQVGRNGNAFKRLLEPLSAWHSGVDLAPVLVYDERRALAYVEELARQVNREMVEASLSVNGVDVTVAPGQVGRSLDAAALLPELQGSLRGMADGLIELPIVESSPVILDASQQAEVIRGILSAPLTLRMPAAAEGDPGPWVIPPENLANMLAIQKVQTDGAWHYEVGLDPVSLTTYVNALAPDIGRWPANARFIFNDDTHLLEVIQPAVIGRTLQVETSVQKIIESVQKGEHTVELDVQTVLPEIGDQATGEQLGITQQVSSYTSYFRGSDASRLNNIKIAAANFHGLLVPPGAVFSMASAMHDVSLDNGYAEAWIIVGGRTIKGVGGGVCQVSTTLFRTVFFGGFPIIERYPHAYRVGYYEQTRTSWDSDLAGLDASVFLPSVDFKFQNDTPYWLLMETYYNAGARSLTWKFYSTSDGRKVDWDTTGLQNIVEPEGPIYEENPELGAGVIKQVDWAVDGADVTVTRIVTRNGEVLYNDVIATHYMPWRDVFQYGPGTELPGSNPKKKPRINPV